MRFGWFGKQAEQPSGPEPVDVIRGVPQYAQCVDSVTGYILIADRSPFADPDPEAEAG